MFSSNTSQVSNAANYIEDVFSTYLYTGNGSTQTITNGIDLSTYGGLVWTKGRSAITDNQLYDTARGVQKEIDSNKTNAQATNAQGITAFGTTGYSMGSDGSLNGSGTTYASWTFRKQPKFFDVVTYTGNAVQGRQIPHNLGSVPGCIIVKSTSSSGTDWVVHHQALGFTKVLYLNTTAAADTTTRIMGATSTTFTVSDASTLNSNGETYVAYLFAHDAGGFGLTGTDNVISCGSFTTDGSGNATVNLGYEPQLNIIKSTGTSDWYITDTMRGAAVGSNTSNTLSANSSAAEVTGRTTMKPNATGFSVELNASTTYIYIAIRRGPMKVPTSGTSVFAPLALANSVNTQNVTGFPIDLQIRKARSVVYGNPVYDRLRGMSSVPSSTSIVMGPQLFSNATDAEATSDDAGYLYDNTSFRTGQNWQGSTAYWNFGRAPSFFDEVCYTGTGTARTVTHNLGVAPELMITKQRSGASQWNVYQVNLGASAFVQFTTAAVTTGDSTRWNNTAPTSSVFSLGTSNSLNSSGQTYVWYGFASCPGVSKVGSYTGTGTTKQVDCGFTGGARFVLIKRTDSTGDWYVWDSARGIVAGNDPYLLLNSTAAEVTNTDYVDTYSAGFEISSTAPAAINANGGTFIFLAIA